ncbi:MAG: deoxyhypusine synthase [Candidatus Lokiarchaeota archaeon]|nr:deoxyhypusine synthase [Candidatus Lokiarchaeota archaeon]MBD3199140.1 deoxyhypusine synthase [Candidatus Lokiarchaeota archaeon]
MNKHNKIDYLNKKIEPLNPKNIESVEDLLTSLQSCGFQGKNLGIALEILYKMVSNEKILTVMTLSGAMVPAGMGEIITTLLEYKLIDILISTGANIIHDLVDTFSDIGHYIGSNDVDDDDLFENRINRIYDVFLPEESYEKAELNLRELIKDLFDEKKIHITPSELFRKIGLNIKKRSILSVAAKNKIPIFVPAFSDSEFALNLIKYSVREGYSFIIDGLKDVLNFAEIIRKSEEYGTLIVGGGVPRNWAQQVFPLLDQLDQIQTMGYNYSVRIHSAMEYDGGLSGCTISESKSWGKYSLDSRYVSVWCDATIALPILISGLLQKLKLT